MQGEQSVCLVEGTSTREEARERETLQTQLSASSNRGKPHAYICMHMHLRIYAVNECHLGW